MSSQEELEEYEIGPYKSKLEGLAIFTLIVQGFAVIVTSCVAILAIKYLLIGKLRGHYETFWIISITGTGTALGFLVASLAQFAALLLYTQDNHMMVYWATGDSYLWCIGKWFQYATLLSRLYFCFRTGGNKVTLFGKDLLIAYGIIVMQIMSAFGWSMVFAWGSNMLLVIATVLFLSTDPIFGLYTCYLFVKKLGQRCETLAEIRASKEGTSFLRVMTRYTVATVCAVSSSSIATIIAAIRWYYFGRLWLWLSSLIVAIDCIISSVAALWIFNFGTSYYTLLCWPLNDRILQRLAIQYGFTMSFRTLQGPTGRNNRVATITVHSVQSDVPGPPSTAGHLTTPLPTSPNDSPNGQSPNGHTPNGHSKTIPITPNT